MDLLFLGLVAALAVATIGLIYAYERLRGPK
jgi:hypothetical protein